MGKEDEEAHGDADREKEALGDGVAEWEAESVSEAVRDGLSLLLPLCDVEGEDEAEDDGESEGE